MTRKPFLTSLLLGSLAASQPASAEPGIIFYDQPERSRIGGYAGVTLSLARTQRNEQMARLRLGLGTRHQAPIGARATPPRQSLLELEPLGGKRPALYLGGQRLSAAGGNGGWGTGETLLALVGVAGALFLATQLDDKDDEDDDEQCMIEPYLCD